MALLILLACLLLGPASAWAYPLVPPSDLVRETLSESVPTAFAPSAITEAHYRVRWKGAPIAGIDFQLAPGTLEWVRVSELLVIPRARLTLVARGFRSGTVRSGAGTQAFEPEGGALEAGIPVALISGSSNPVTIRLARDGGIVEGALEVEFSPGNETAPLSRATIDPSCSRFGLSLEPAALPSGQWAHIGCRLVRVRGTGHETSSLELWIYWDNLDGGLALGETPVEPVVPGLWLLTLRPGANRASLRPAGGEPIELTYRIARELKRGSVGLGFGPYVHTFRSGLENETSWTGMPTIYGSYFVAESMRLVAFQATTLNRSLVTDLGFYINNESFRAVDRRLSIHVMLGIHFNGFKSGNAYYLIPGAPQGFELIYIDFLKPGFNLMLGGFVYPAISDKSYYNLWLRWGSSSLFAELNYISWEERVSSRDISSRAVGVSAGFPLSFLSF